MQNPGYAGAAFLCVIAQPGGKIHITVIQFLIEQVSAVVYAGSMRRADIVKAASAALLLGLTSCTNLCQYVADCGAEYDGVELTERECYYRHGGRKYVRGQRAKFKRTSVQNPYLLGKPIPDQYEVKPETLGEVVYRELQLDRGGMWSLSGNWKSLTLHDTRAYPMPEKTSLGWSSVNEYSRKLTPHALYAYPLATVVGVCIDVPLNIAGGAAAVCFAGGALVVSGVVNVVTWCLPESDKSADSSPE